MSEQNTVNKIKLFLRDQGQRTPSAHQHPQLVVECSTAPSLKRQQYPEMTECSNAPNMMTAVSKDDRMSLPPMMMTTVSGHDRI